MKKVLISLKEFKLIADIANRLDEGLRSFIIWEIFERLPEAPQWVSVHWPAKETLPLSFSRNEYSQAPFILTRWIYRTECKTISGRIIEVIRRCKFIDNKFVFAKDEALTGSIDAYVTHWMPIPPLPGDKDDN